MADHIEQGSCRSHCCIHAELRGSRTAGPQNPAIATKRRELHRQGFRHAENHRIRRSFGIPNKQNRRCNVRAETDAAISSARAADPAASAKAPSPLRSAHDASREREIWRAELQNDGKPTCLLLNSEPRRRWMREALARRPLTPDPSPARGEGELFLLPLREKVAGASRSDEGSRRKALARRPLAPGLSPARTNAALRRHPNTPCRNHFARCVSRP